MKQEKYGFVYIWFDSARSKRNDENHIKRFYIGSHWGTVDDGYICSSKWMRRSFRRRPEDFKRRILKTNINDRKLLLEEEHKFLSRIKNEELGKRYYNVHNHHYGHWSSNPETLQKISDLGKKRIVSEETKAKIRQANLGKKQSSETKEKRFKNGVSEETKQKLSASGKGRIVSPETREKIRNSLIGKHLPEERRQKISVSKTGKKTGPHSPEWNEKIRLSNKNNKRDRFAENNPFFGKKHSEETKLRISNTKKSV
jgi:hypothetical protein